MNNDITTLRGQRDVLVRLLTEALEPLGTIIPDMTCEGVMLDVLMREIRAALQGIAQAKLESTHD